jgi:molybdenum cofactor synthesis domain-containing protein
MPLKNGSPNFIPSEVKRTWRIKNEAAMPRQREFLEISEKEEVEGIIANIGREVVKKRMVQREKVKTGEALGRVAAADVFSPLDIPPFDKATMDGYAVVASDTFYADENSPASLIIQGYIAAGEISSQRVGKGCCRGISTGAPLPDGADAVVMVEYTIEYEDEEAIVTNEEKKRVRIYKPVAPTENIMAKGSDIGRGAKIVRKETVLTPKETGVLAACGIKEVIVYTKPKVAIISTGNEIIAIEETVTSTTLPPGKIYDINSQTIVDSVRETGCIPLFMGIARDNREEIREKIKDGLKMDVDAIIVSGGTSAGVGDILPTVIEELGEIVVHGVDIKPGKPFLFALIKEKPVFGLPGNPTSALITFNLFVAPLLTKMAGVQREHEDRVPRKMNAKTGIRIFSERGRNEYVLVNLKRASKEKEKVTFFAYPILTGSGAITTLSNAEGYIFVEKGVEIIEEGEEVEVGLLSIKINQMPYF